MQARGADLTKEVKREKKKRAQIINRHWERFEELSEDPMGTVLAGVFLLVEELRQIVDMIRREYEIDLPDDLEKREIYIKRNFTGKAQEKIWRRIYKKVGEVEEIKDWQQAMVELANSPMLLAKFRPAPLKKPGRPKKRWQEWPQLDVTHTLYNWLFAEIIWPLPRYFYDPELKLSCEGVPMTVAVFSSLNGKTLTEDGAIIRLDAGKRKSETLVRDVYYYLLRNGHEPKLKYLELAQYAVNAGFEEIEYDP